MKVPPSVSPASTLEAQKPSLLEKLSRISFFKGIPEEALRGVEHFFVEAFYPKESVIFREQDHPDQTGARIHFVVDGCVKLVKYSTDGESTIVRLASLGEFFGVTSALTSKAYPFSAEASTDTAVVYLNLENYKRLVSLYPEIALDMLCAMGEVLWFNYATHNQVVKKSEARVAKIILYHLKRDGSDETAEGMQLRIQLPHDYIASMTGIAYEESVRIISRLKKQHQCIKYLRGGKIIITDYAAIRSVAQDTDGLGY